MRTKITTVVITILGVTLAYAGFGMASDEGGSLPSSPCVVMEDNVIYGNNLAGIRVRGSIPVTVARSEIHGNGRTGIYLDAHSQVTVLGCDIFRNSRAGVNIDKAAMAVIEGGRIYENDFGGIRIQRSPGPLKPEVEVRIARCSIYRNMQGGIRVMIPVGVKLYLTVLDSIVALNTKAGIRVENDTVFIAKGNDVFGNGTAGIVSYVSEVPPTLSIYQNRVGFNRTAGIHVINGVTGEVGVRNNWVFHNERSGILCGLWSDPDDRLLDIDIINNTVVSNGAHDQGVGIRNDSNGRAVIRNNIVAYNIITGIRTKECYDESYNLLYANGDIGNCCDEPHTAPYWIERTQFAGCPERGKGDLLCDPKFVDPDNYDFSLQDQSPAIDAGTDDEPYQDVYFSPSKGTARNDIGATGGPYAAAGIPGLIWPAPLLGGEGN